MSQLCRILNATAPPLRVLFTLLATLIVLTITVVPS
jgi:hypothetical protein